MKSAFLNSEVAFSRKNEVGAQDPNSQPSALEIISHDMQSGDLQRVIEIAVHNYMETNDRMTDFVSEEQFFMIVAQSIGEKLDAANIADGPWQVFLGQHYGSFVTHESFYFVNFKYDQLWFTIYVSS